MPSKSRNLSEEIKNPSRAQVFRYFRIKSRNNTSASNSSYEESVKLFIRKRLKKNMSKNGSKRLFLDLEKKLLKKDPNQLVFQHFTMTTIA